jgi:hypothetical protein
MNTSDIIAELANCNYVELTEIRAALDERAQAIKAEFMAQAEAMGLACHDDNGKPKRKRRNNQEQSEQEEHADA